jgi:hypothetical protein
MSKEAYYHAQHPIYSNSTFEIMFGAKSGLHKGPRGITSLYRGKRPAYVLQYDTTSREDQNVGDPEMHTRITPRNL